MDRFFEPYFLFVSTTLFEPLHYFFVSHEHVTNHITESKANLSKKAEDCPICKFHFCTFINNVSLFKETRIVTQNYSKIVSFKIHLKSIIITYKKGRAPPVS